MYWIPLRNSVRLVACEAHLTSAISRKGSAALQCPRAVMYVQTGSKKHTRAPGATVDPASSSEMRRELARGGGRWRTAAFHGETLSAQVGSVNNNCVQLAVTTKAAERQQAWEAPLFFHGSRRRNYGE